MPIATGVARQVRIKKEVTWGTAPGAGSAQLYRRLQHSLNLQKNTFQSNEIRSNYQISDFRHGYRRVEGSLNGEMSPGTYSQLVAAGLRRDFSAVAAMTGLSITIAVAGNHYTLTRGAGSWLTDGVKKGMILRLTAGAFTAGNLNINLRVISIGSATEVTVEPDGGTLTAEGPIAAATVSVPGKITYIPTTGHTDDSFYIEDWHSAISVSERFAGCKVNQIQGRLPPTGPGTIDFAMLGKDMSTGAAEYYTSPTAETSTGIVAANNGALRVGSSDLVVVTGLNFTVNGNMSSAEVIGTNVTPAIFPGRVMVNGDFTALFEDGTLRDAFLNETEVEIVAYVKSDGSNGGDFISWVFPRCKLGSASLDDGDKGLVRSYSFQALYDSTGGSGQDTEATTIWVQDSQAA